MAFAINQEEANEALARLPLGLILFFLILLGGKRVWEKDRETIAVVIAFCVAMVILFLPVDFYYLAIPCMVFSASAGTVIAVKILKV